MSDGDISINLRLDDRDFSVTVRNANRLLSELRRNLDVTATGIRGVENHFNSFTTKLRHTVMTLASVRFAMMDIHDVFLQLPKAILRSSGEVERLTKLMEGLSKETTEAGRQQEALANTKFVFNIAQNAPFEVKAISDAFVKLKIAGLDPASGSLQTLIDSLARFGGTSEHLHRASVAIQQMTGKGVISMEELRQQLGEAMPTAMRAMAQGTGLTMGALVDKISRGTVEATSALERMFAVLKVENDGAALKMMDTYVGQIEKLKTGWTIFANEVGQSGGFLTEVVNQLKVINEALSSGQAKVFAHELSEGLAGAVRGIANLVGMIRTYSSELVTLGKVVLAVWGGAKLFGIINSMKAAYGGFLTTYIGGVKALIGAEQERVMIANANANQEIANKRRVIMEEARANAQRIAQNASAAAAELAQNRAKWAALEAEGNAYRVRYHAANQIATTRRLADGRVASAAEVATQRALATAYFERAMAAERMAVRIKAAEASLVATSTGAMAALRANTTAATAAMAGLGTATVATTSRMAVLRGALGLLGGPIGWITTLLTAGAFAWFQWGNSAEKAASKAADALQRVKNGYATLEDARTMSERIADIGKQIGEKEGEINSGGSGTLGYSPSKMNQLRADLAKLKKERDDLSAELGSASAQGTETAIQDTVRMVDQRVQSVINAEKAANNRLIEGQRAELERRLKEGLISKEDHYKQEVALTKALATKNAEAEIEAIKAQKAVVEKSLKDAEFSQAGGADSPLYKGYERQLESLSNAQRNAEAGLASALKIGTESEYVKKNKDGAGGGGVGNMISSMIDQAKADLAAASIKLDDLADGVISFQRLRDAAMAEITADIRSGKIKGADAGTASELAELRARLEQRKLEIAAEKRLNRLESDVSVARSSAADRFNNGDTYEKESTGVAKLRKELERIKQTLPETSGLFKNFEQATRGIISDQAIADLQNFAADLKKASNELNISLLPTERQRQEATFQAEIALMRSQFEVRRKEIVEDAKLTSDERSKQIMRAEEELTNWLALKAQEQAMKMRTPLQQLADDWKDVTQQMGQLEQKWANGFIDTLHQAMMTGKADWRSFLESIASDFLKMTLQKNLADSMTAIFGGLGGALGGLAGGGAEGAASSGMSAVATAAGSAASSLIAFNAAMQGSAASTTLNTTATTANTATTTGNTVATGVNTATTGQNTAQSWASTLISKTIALFKTTTELAADAAAASGAMSLAAATNTAAAQIAGAGATASAGSASSGWMSAVGSAVAGFFGFAKGGVMTPGGPLDLKAYAKGGVANSPQLALFGEGDMNEAFVPLPDGRSIPVTLSAPMMSGTPAGRAAPMVVNIHEAPGTKANVSQSDDGQGGMTLEIMIEQVEGKMASNISRGRSPVANTLENVYGLNRAAGARR